MTRSEYLRLLSTARVLGKRQLYLLIKVFAGTGLPVRALPKVIVEETGTPLGRTNVSNAIWRLCAEARVPLEKGNPRCLRRLY